MSPLTRLAQLVIADPKAAVSMASRIVTQEKARRARKAAKSAPRRAKEKESKEARRERIAAIRAEVFRIAGGMCEALDRTAPATELHHVLGGPDRQRLEAVENCVALCHQCHADAPTNAEILETILELPRLSAEARRSLQRRIDKIKDRTP